MKKTNLVVLVCLVVVGTILLVIPNLPGPRPNPSSAAIGYLRSILEAENQHHSSKGVYGTLEQLSNGDPPFLDGILGKMDLGYRISLAVGSEGKSFKAIAVPDKLDLRESHDSTNKQRFCVDESGVIRYTTDGSEPNKDSTPLGE